MRAREKPEPFEVGFARWIWGVRIPWLPDLLAAGEEASVTGYPLIEAFGRQIGLLRAIAAANTLQHFQFRFISSSDSDLPVQAQLLGGASTAGLAGEAATLALGALPAEYPTEPLGEQDVADAMNVLGDGLPTAATFVEIRRAIEPLFVSGDESQGAGSPPDGVVIPWTWSPQALLSTIDLLRRQSGRSLLAVHVEPRRPSAELTIRLTTEIDRFQRLLTERHENPLLITAMYAYRRWLRDLPNEALHLRLFLASTEPLSPGAGEFVGADLTRSWETQGGPSAVTGTFSVTKPVTDRERQQAQLLVSELVSVPYDQPGDEALAELQSLFGAQEANTAFRLPVTPRGGLEGVATLRLSTLGAGRLSRSGTTSDDPIIGIGRLAGGGVAGISLHELSQHVLVAGLPGFGKTTTVQRLLLALQELPIPVPFLVIDPAKQDYRHLISQLSRRNRPCRLIRLDHDHPALNPLAPPVGVDVRVHAGRVLAALDSVFKLSERWRFGYLVLARAVYAAYEQADPGAWPSLADLHRVVRIQIARLQLKESGEIEAALAGRIELLAGGPAGAALLGGPDAGIDWEEIMGMPTVVELGAFAGEERSLMFALILAGLVSWREAHRVPNTLAHVTVLEEAHRVLSGQSETAGVATFVEAIAELRGAGEGFAVVEQAPSLLHRGVVKLAGSKIAHRIVEFEERTLLGASMLLDARQADELGRLAPGRAVIHTASSSAAALAEVEPLTDTSQVIPDLAFRRQLSRPGSSAQSLTCSRCPKPCSGRRGRALSPQLIHVGVGLTPLDEGTALGAAAYRLAKSGPGPMISAFCAAAHVLALRHISSLSDLDESSEAALRGVKEAHVIAGGAVKPEAQRGVESS